MEAARERAPPHVGRGLVERYGPNVGAAVVAVADPERVRAFAELVAPLETRAGKPLGPPARSAVFAAFCESPDGFRRCIDAAGERGKDPLRLLIHMIRCGDHRSVGEAA